MDKNKNNAQVTLEENGLRVESKRFFDDLSAIVTNIELERRHEEQKQQFQAAQNNQRNEQSPPPAQNNQSAPVTNQPADNNSSTLSLGGIGLNDSIEKVRQILGREDRISGEPTNSKHEYRDIVITYNGRRILGMVSYSPAEKISATATENEPEESATVTAKFCSNCGKQLDDCAKFCGKCGTPCTEENSDTPAQIAEEITNTSPAEKISATATENEPGKFGRLSCSRQRIVDVEKIHGSRSSLASSNHSERRG